MPELKESPDDMGPCTMCKHNGVKTLTKFYCKNAKKASVWRCKSCHDSIDDDDTQHVDMGNMGNMGDRGIMGGMSGMGDTNDTKVDLHDRISNLEECLRGQQRQLHEQQRQLQEQQQEIAILKVNVRNMRDAAALRTRARSRSHPRSR